MIRKFNIVFLTLILMLSPFQIKASEYETESIHENNTEVFKAVDMDGNIFDIPVDEDVVIKNKYDADPTTVTYGIVNLKTKPSAAYNTYYTDVNTGQIGYINGYAASDAAFIGLTSDKKQVKFKISGATGLVDVSEVQVLNYKNCKSISHYKASSGYLYHYGTTDVSSDSYIITNNVGPTPSYLSENVKYYSYDGHYFYTSFEKMIDDYKKNTYANSVNPNSPYYNYFQFLPSRSLTNVSAKQMNDYIPSYAKNGKMANLGQDLIDAQNTYGVNALFMYVQAAFESGWGTSALAMNKNNLFGHAAADNNPYYGANGYNSVQDCVTYHAKVVLSEGFFDPKDYGGRFYGTHVGDRNSGISVKYGSDPYWGEKIASLCWIIDKQYGTNDHSIYTVGIKESNTSYNVYANEDKAKVFFKTGTFTNYPVIILDENSMYKIQSDSTLKSDRSDIIQDQGKYDFNLNYAYIQKDAIRIISNGNHQYPSASMYKWVKKDGVWFLQDSSGKNATGWKQVNGKWYYLDLEDGHMVTGWLKDLYYLDIDGHMVTDWFKINNSWYYFDENGKKQTGWIQLDNKWYYLDSKGVMLTGFQTINGKTYYLNSYMYTGWQKIDSNWYLFESNGSMIIGWKKDADKWYYMDKNGVMLTGLQSIDGKTYYLNNYMKTGWQKISNHWYYFNNSMVTGWIKLNGLWYYMDNNGVMVTGWKQINGTYYYFYSNGSMAKNTYIGKYYVDSSGAWIK